MKLLIFLLTSKLAITALVWVCVIAGLEYGPHWQLLLAIVALAGSVAGRAVRQSRQPDLSTRTVE